jgi:DNA-binding transcriptional MerR regulator
MPDNRWRVGDLARAAGITVRTLHHYEAVGLLVPSARTEAGHRVYDVRDVRRLYQILALRRLGLGLAETADCINRDEGALGPVVRRHLQAVERQLEAQARLRLRLQFILTAVEGEEQPPAERFFEAMEAMTVFERYYTAEQLAQLEARRNMLGDESIKAAEQQWADLIREAEEARAAGVDPASPQAQGLARRWRELIEQFTGGDQGIRQSLQKMYESEGPQKASHGMVSPELVQWIQQAGSAGGSR